MILEPFGTCDTAETGQEALDAVRMAFKEQAPYDLVCLDMMMPGMTGQQVLQGIRQMEKEEGVPQEKATKVLMMTGVSDKDHVLDSFASQCEAYLIKPVSRQRLLKQLVNMGLIQGYDQTEDDEDL